MTLITSAWDNIDSTINKKTNEIPTIAICIPYNGNWNPEWVEKTYIPLKQIHTDFCNKINFLSKAPSLPVARDALVKSALDNNCDYIFWMDSDHVFEQPIDPNNALKILYDCINKDKSKDGKIVSALYRAKQKVGFNYAMWRKFVDKDGNIHDNKFVPINEWTGNWLNVDTVGFGCCLIKSEIFKDVQRPWFRWDTTDDISEDFYFCSMAREKGYNIHVMTDIKLSHLGQLKVKSDGTIVIPEL